MVVGVVGIACVGMGAALLGTSGDDAPASEPTSKADLASTFKGLLPKGRITEPSRLGAGHSPYAAEVVYDDGRARRPSVSPSAALSRVSRPS